METQNDSGSVESFAAKINRELGLSPWSLEASQRFKAEVAKRKFQAMKRRAEAKDRQWAEAKQRLRQKLKRNREEVV